MPAICIFRRSIKGTTVIWARWLSNISICIKETKAKASSQKSHRIVNRSVQPFRFVKIRSPLMRSVANNDEERSCFWDWNSCNQKPWSRNQHCDCPCVNVNRPRTNKADGNGCVDRQGDTSRCCRNEAKAVGNPNAGILKTRFLKTSYCYTKMMKLAAIVGPFACEAILVISTLTTPSWRSPASSPCPPGNRTWINSSASCAVVISLLSGRRCRRRRYDPMQQKVFILANAISMVCIRRRDKGLPRMGGP